MALVSSSVGTYICYLGASNTTLVKGDSLIHSFRCRVNSKVNMAIAAQGISFTGETSMLNSDTLVALGIQLAGQQFAFQFLDDC